MEQETVLHIEGTVEQVLYRNEQNGYTVLDLDANGPKKRIRTFVLIPFYHSIWFFTSNCMNICSIFCRFNHRRSLSHCHAGSALKYRIEPDGPHRTHRKTTSSIWLSLWFHYKNA